MVNVIGMPEDGSLPDADSYSSWAALLDTVPRAQPGEVRSPPDVARDAGGFCWGVIEGCRKVVDCRRAMAEVPRDIYIKIIRQSRVMYLGLIERNK